MTDGNDPMVPFVDIRTFDHVDNDWRVKLTIFIQISYFLNIFFIFMKIF